MIFNIRRSKDTQYVEAISLKSKRKNTKTWATIWRNRGTNQQSHSPLCIVDNIFSSIFCGFNFYLRTIRAGTNGAINLNLFFEPTQHADKIFKRWMLPAWCGIIFNQNLSDGSSQGYLKFRFAKTRLEKQNGIPQKQENMKSIFLNIGE